MQANRYPETYQLRYFQEQLPGFNGQGLATHGIERYAGTKFARTGNHTQQPGADMLDVINAAIRRANPNARLATVVDGQLQLPYPYLIKVQKRGGKLIKRNKYFQLWTYYN